MDKEKSGRDPAILLSKESQGKGANKSLLKNNTGNKNEIKKGCLLVDYIPRLKFKKLHLNSAIVGRSHHHLIVEATHLLN